MSKFDEYLEAVTKSTIINEGNEFVGKNTNDILNMIVKSNKSSFIIPFIEKTAIGPNEILELTPKENKELLALKGGLEKGLKEKSIRLDDYDFSPVKESGKYYAALKIDITRK
jgi:hypothetical protein